MNTPEVSVIVPTYNRAHLVARAVDSVLGQTYRPCHVILVDDGSTDGTADLISRRYAHEPRVHYVHQRNRGVSAARNTALEQATGDYLAFLDSDDFWRPWKLQVDVACLTRLGAEGVEMVWSEQDIVNDDGVLIQRSGNRTRFGVYQRYRLDQLFSASRPLAELVPDAADPGVETRVHWGDVFPWIVLGNLCAPSSVVLTRARANKTGPFDESMTVGEDYDYHVRACAVGPSAFVDAASFAYRMGGDDQLTGEKYQILISQNALRTTLAALATKGLGQKLSAGLIRAKLASSNAWIGRQMLDRRNRAGARKHFMKSLLQRPDQPRVWALLAAATLPHAVRERLAAWKRPARSRP